MYRWTLSGRLLVIGGWFGVRWLDTALLSQGLTCVNKGIPTIHTKDRTTDAPETRRFSSLFTCDAHQRRIPLIQGRSALLYPIANPASSLSAVAHRAEEETTLNISNAATHLDSEKHALYCR